MPDPTPPPNQNMGTPSTTGGAPNESAPHESQLGNSVERLVRLEYLQGFLREQLQDIKGFLSRFFWGGVVAIGGLAGTLFWSTMHIVDRIDDKIEEVKGTLTQHTASLNRIEAQTSAGAVRSQLEKELSTPFVLRFESLDGTFSEYGCGSPVRTARTWPGDEALANVDAAVNVQMRDCVEIAKPSSKRSMKARARARLPRP